MTRVCIMPHHVDRLMRARDDGRTSQHSESRRMGQFYGVDRIRAEEEGSHDLMRMTNPHARLHV